MDVLDDFRDVQIRKQVFTVPEEGARKVARRTRNLMFIIFPVMLLVGVGITLFISANTLNWMDMAPIFIFMVIFGLIAGILRGRKAYRTWKSFHLTLGDNEIIREMNGYAPFHLRKEDITEVRILKGGEICIVGQSMAQNIIITRFIDRREELLKALESYGPVTQVTHNRLLPGYIHYMYLAYPVLLLLSFALDNKWFSLVSFAAITFISIWTITYILRSPQLPVRQKLMVLFYLIVLLVIGWKTGSAFGILPPFLRFV